MSCLKDYKIVPSKPYDVASGYNKYNQLMIWGWITISSITGVWFFRNVLKGVRSHTEPDLSAYELTPTHILFRRHNSEGARSSKREGKGIDPTAWTFWGMDLILAAFWFYQFNGLVESQHRDAPVSMLGWITPWIDTMGLLSHPFACRYPWRTKLAKTCLTLLTLTRIVHWALCIHT